MKSSIFGTGYLMKDAKISKTEGDRIMVTAVVIENHSYFKDEKKVEVVTRIPFCMWLNKDSKLPAQLKQGQGVAIQGSLYNPINKETGKPGFNVAISVDSSDLKLFGKKPENKVAPAPAKTEPKKNNKRNSSKKAENHDLSNSKDAEFEEKAA